MDEDRLSAISTPAPAPRPWWARLADRSMGFLVAYRVELVIFGFFSLVALVFMLPMIYHTIPAGHVGVLWKRFGGGTVTEQSYPEGFRLTFPWDTLHIYDARLRKVEREVDVLSSDGLKIVLTLVWRYRLHTETVATLHKFAGPNYAETLIAPTVGARARDIIAVYRPDEVYTEQRLKIQDEIIKAVRLDLDTSFNPDGAEDVQWLVMEDILIKGMTLPPGVQDAIVSKNAMFHQMEEFSFRIQREQKEAERKRIEALGVRNFQEIVSNGMSDSYLRWRGIEATLELAKSPNAKVVIVGNAKNGMPLILNTDSKETAETTSTNPKARSGN